MQENRQREKKFSKTEIIKKPWLAQKKLLEMVEVRLDGADVFDTYMKEQKAEPGRTEATVKLEKEKSKVVA
jgi:hypothetical protein